ncbi:MAG: zinc ribbon domain-containing protein, partial [Ktedonobacterales bacterium]
MDSDTCLRCGAPYAPGQTVCFKCGAPLGETRPNTQPVPVIRIPRPEHDPQPVVATAPAHLPSPVASAVAEPPPRPARGKRRWPIVLGLLVLVLAAAGGGFYLVRALTAAPPVAAQTLYRDSQHRFSFERPTLWAVTSTSGGVTLTDTSGASTVAVTVAQPNPGDTAQSRADVLARSLGLTAAPPQTIGGDTWEQRAGQFTGA